MHARCFRVEQDRLFQETCGSIRYVFRGRLV